VRGHPWRFVALVYFVVAVAAALVYRSTVAAQAEAAVVLATVLETPGLTWTVERLTDEPRVEETNVAGMPTTLVRPRGAGPWPAVVFVNGATRLGRDHPRVRALAHGLGRAGYLVVVPDLPGLRESEITTRTLDAALAVSRATVDRRDARDGRIALVGVSVGAALALLVAEDPALARRVSIVAGIAPYADLRNMLRLATTGHYSEQGKLVRYTTDRFLVRVATRSLMAEARAAAAKDAVARLLSNRDPGRFETLYAALPPEIHTDHVRLSPIVRANRLRAPVELASAPQDRYFPLGESRALAAGAPAARLTVTTTLDHAIPEPDDIPDAVRFDAFVVRVLERAARA
jgi:pimeloyl-ACP methyl ester carboxylesterase